MAKKPDFCIVRSVNGLPIVVNAVDAENGKSGLESS
jgi:hypothetical protein